MKYRSCGELDRYRDTINLIQAQLDASGCDCACCDDNSYYWVSNNSANSIIDEILANFQFRLYTGPGAPSASEVGVELGALWQDTTTGILYRCTGATPGSLTWALYYDPSVVPLTGADNGLSVSSGDVILGGSLDSNTTIDLNTRRLTLSGTTGDVEILSTIGTALDVTGTTNALSLTGTTNALDVTATTNTAATLKVDRTTNNTVATNLILQTNVDSGVGDAGIGSSIQFKSEGTSSTITTAAIESAVTNASTGRGTLEFKVKAGGASPSTSLVLNDDLSATLKNYGAGNYTGTDTYSLSVDSAGNVIETPPAPKLFVAKVTNPSPGVYSFAEVIDTTGGAVSITYSAGAYTISSSNSAFTLDKTFITATLDVGTNAIFTAFYSSTSQILVQTTVPGGAAIDALPGGYIKIEIYP
jgi:hypothetical protein